ncbi:hypothetical protein QF004_001532 [Chryseobacterium sp. MDT2-18]|uniref:Uncharacterized protein n=1 Tax=Chryseobacterium salivictor TaxID=2547600 RepID=A0A4P6ZCW9_9FLAO|nr:hypothetical protein [Chryseobacterium sp. MDT2-18]QBO57376.1 hypothetical protein NBC122_00527 [Chryseobacterium salivictor]
MGKSSIIKQPHLFSNKEKQNPEFFSGFCFIQKYYFNAFFASSAFVR